MTSRYRKKHALRDSNSILPILLMMTVVIFFAIAFDNFGFFNGTGVHNTNQFMFGKVLSHSFIAATVIFVLFSAHIALLKTLEKKYVIGFLGAIIPLTYILSGADAVSPYLSFITIGYMVSAYAFLLVGIIIADKEKWLVGFLYLYLAIGFFVSLYSFTYIIGNQYKLDALMDSGGIRLASIFTYPNAYALFLITLIIISLYFLAYTKSIIHTILLGCSLSIFTTSFLLTLSRGGMLVLPVIAIAALLIFNMRKQIWLIVYILISFILSLFLQSPLLSRGNQFFAETSKRIEEGNRPLEIDFFSKESLSSWLFILAISVITSLIIGGLKKFIESRVDDYLAAKEDIKGSRFWIPGFVIAFLAIAILLLSSGSVQRMLPSSLAERVNTISLNTHSVLERFTIYKDAFRLWQDHFLIGAGGGAWEALYEQYRTYPYVSAQTHSFPVQVLVETGLVGFLCIFGFIIFAIGRSIMYMVRVRSGDQGVSGVFTLLAAAILIHSLIDFSLSYLFFAALLFFSLGVPLGQPDSSEKKVIAAEKVKWFNRSFAVVTLAVAVALGIFANNQQWIQAQFNKSVTQQQQNSSIEEILTTLNKGLDRFPNHPYLLERASIYLLTAYTSTGESQFLQEAITRMDVLAAKEPQMYLLPKIEFELAYAKADLEEAANVLDKAIERDPFQIDNYEMAMQIRHSLWMQALQADDTYSLNKNSEKIQDLHQQAVNLQNRLITIHDAIIFNNTFQVTEEMDNILASVQREN